MRVGVRLHLIGRVQVGPVADAVGVELGDRLEDALGPVRLARVHGLLEEVAVAELIGLDVVRRGVTCLGAGQVEPDNGQAQAIAGIHHRPRQGVRRGPVDLLDGPALEDPQQVAVVGAESPREHAHRARDDAVPERRLLSDRDRIAALVLALEAIEPAGDRGEDAGGVHVATNVQLRREPDLEVPHALGGAVLAELVGHALERLLVGEDGARVGEPVQVVGQVAVAVLEHELAQPLGRPRGQRDPSGAGEVDEGLEPERPVEVAVQVGLRKRGEQGVGVHAAGYPRPLLPASFEMRDPPISGRSSDSPPKDLSGRGLVATRPHAAPAHHATSTRSTWNSRAPFARLW